jgi:SAM-dependent methyltransferase
MEQGLTAYEKNQRFNPINTWLHSRRYRNIRREFAALKLGRPIRVLDIGCAHAPLYAALSDFDIDYTGIEINNKMANVAVSRYGDRKNFRLVRESALTAETGSPDVVVALETFEHIPGREVVRLIEKIASLRPICLIASVPIEIGPSIWIKNVGSLLMRYPRYREYTWRETFDAGLYRLDRLPPHHINHKGFDWRWLAQTIRHNMQITTMRALPFPFLPFAVSTSVFFVAKPRESAPGQA